MLAQLSNNDVTAIIELARRTLFNQPVGEQVAMVGLNELQPVLSHIYMYDTNPLDSNPLLGAIKNIGIKGMRNWSFNKGRQT